MKEELKAALLAGFKKKEITLSDGRKVVVTQMKVREHKKLIDTPVEEQEAALMSAIKSCIETKINFDLLPMYDFELIAFEIRKLGLATPVNNITFICQNEIDGNKCGTEIKVENNLNCVRLSKLPETLIQLNSQVSVKIRYPNLLEAQYFNVEKPSDLFDLSLRMIQEIHLGNDVMKVGIDIQPEELLELNDYIDSDAFDRLTEAVANMPTLVADVGVKCPKCGHHEAVRLRGLSEILDM